MLTTSKVYGSSNLSSPGPWQLLKTGGSSLEFEVKRVLASSWVFPTSLHVPLALQSFWSSWMFSNVPLMETSSFPRLLLPLDARNDLQQLLLLNPCNPLHARWHFHGVLATNFEIEYPSIEGLNQVVRIT